MPSLPRPLPLSSVLSPGVLAMLACPVCHGSLQLIDGDPGSQGEPCIECGGCQRRYPVVDDIPVLIPERALA